MARARSVGEFELIAAIDELVRASGRHRGVRIGIGDDAALLDTASKSIITTDALVEGVHFRREWLTPAQIGARAFRVASSDIAAMGAVSRYVLLSLTIPTRMDRKEVFRLVSGLVADADQAGTALVGGNISSGPVLSLSLTVVGTPGPRVLTRSGARRGDAIVVTGTLGDAAGVEQLGHGRRRGALIDRYRVPPSRLALGARLARGRDVTAAMDLSDGLGGDLAHLCRASQVSAGLDLDAVPISKALKSYARRAGSAPLDYAMRGEDYELLMTIGNGDIGLRRVKRACSALGVESTTIGVIESRSKASPVHDSDGAPLPSGWDHLVD